MNVIYLLVAFVAALIFYSFMLYNKLVRMKNRIDNAWSQVKVQLKRRWDLIPNLVSTVKGYAAHESQTLEAVTAARNAAAGSGASDIAQSAQTENALTASLRQLFAVAESYPDLKANESFLALQKELTDTENKISYARQFYNDSVMTYNTAIQLFPANFLSGPFGFLARGYFEIDKVEEEPVTVEF
ncbi:MAG: LemA family protein [Coriobacteriia bacterium]|nr:LemA family protein [Coriobacteriia bacterium]